MNTLTVIPPPKAPALKKIITLDDLWKTYVAMKGELAPSSLELYNFIGRHFCNFMRDRPLVPQSMLKWMQHLQGKGTVGPRQINHWNVTVRSFLRWLHTYNYIREPLWTAVPSLNAPAPKEAQIFTEAEYERIKAWCSGRTWCQIHLWLIILGYRTGMSLVDCCHLRWCHVHLDDNGPSYIMIHRIKTARLGHKAKCHIPIIPFSDVHLWLLHLRANTERYQRADGITDYVHQDAPGFYACKFSPLRQDFWTIFRKAGIAPGKTFRHFRNSFCSNLVNSGAQLALVCQMTGHNSVKTLLRYLQPDARALQDGLARAQQFAIANGGIGQGASGFGIPNDAASCQQSIA